MTTTETLPTARPSITTWSPRWTLYAIDGCLLGCFMLSACLVGILLHHPDSPLPSLLPSPFVRRTLGGIAMGLTAITLIYSPLGKRSGALMNPAVTLCFLRLGRLHPADAILYVLAQFTGGTLAMLVVSRFANSFLSHPEVHYVATTPGPAGTATAFAAELTISFLLLTAIFAVNRRPGLAPYTGCFAGLLIATFITFESPLSGMSMNPARTFASAFPSHTWTAYWLYATAPVLGMFAATELHHRLWRRPPCGRLSHCRHTPSPFKCNCLAPHTSDSHEVP